ncbi:MAG: CoB--CoM heterodisulfide reductase iron-sulfur subunit B family protein [Actinomycetota bacterium]|nr:CoB--CoM heterodisulfide reductase iron-sulfur subunit B family protein [Actinomycetota bacterium]
MAQETNKIAYYPGCSLNSTAIDFNISITKLLKVLGIGFKEIEDWNCCGTTPAHHTNEELSATLSARNLLLADKMGYDEILCPCVSCYNKLSHAAKMLNTSFSEMNPFEQEKKQQLVSDLKEMGFELKDSYGFKIYSILNYLFEKKELIRQKYLEISQTSGYNKSSLLAKIAPACYYGCALLRSNKLLKFDDIENPNSMEILLKDIGITSKSFQFKTECCGAIMSLTHKDLVLKLSKDILEMAYDCKANCIVVFCQLCQQNLDLRQSQINRYFKTEYKIPVLYLTQILGLALGLSEREVMLDKLFVSPNI